jgi:hypothetical protein
MDLSNIVFKKPENKKNYFIAHFNKKLYHNIEDITIKKLSVLQSKKGYILSVYVNPEHSRFLQNIDNVAKQSILLNYKDWFDKDTNNLTTDDIESLLIPSYCSQNNVVNLFLSNDNNKHMLKIDDKQMTISDLLSIIGQTSAYKKEYTLNIALQHNGMYIYPHQILNKWSISSISAYSNEEPEADEKQDIEDFWKQMLDNADTSLESQIMRIQYSRETLKNLYQEITKEKKSNKEWEYKIDEFKNLIQNIIF